MLKMGCLNFCLQISSWAVLGEAELDVCPKDERQWIQHLARKTDTDTRILDTDTRRSVLKLNVVKA